MQIAKKLITVLLALVLCAALPGCSHTAAPDLKQVMTAVRNTLAALNGYESFTLDANAGARTAQARVVKNERGKRDARVTVSDGGTYYLTKGRLFEQAGEAFIPRADIRFGAETLSDEEVDARTEAFCAYAAAHGSEGEIAEADDGYTLKYALDYRAEINEYIRAITKNKDTKLAALLDAVFKVAVPDGSVTVKRLKDEWKTRLTAAGDKTVNEMLEEYPAVLTVLDLAAGYGPAATAAAYLRANGTRTVNEAFADLVEAVFPEGGEANPDVAVAVFIDYAYSAYLTSNKYTLKELSSALGLPLYEYAVQMETFGTRAENALLELTFRVDRDWNLLSVSAQARLAVSGFPRAESGAYTAGTIERNISAEVRVSDVNATRFTLPDLLR